MLGRLGGVVSCGLAAAALGCGSSDAPAAEPAIDPALADVVFEGSAEAAALEQLLAAQPSSDPARGPVIDSPSADATLPAFPAVTFAWHPGAPMSGAEYFLVFATEQDPSLLRVFTSATTYLPDDAAWATLRSVGTWTALSIESAAFADGQLVDGPYQGTPVAFCIER